MVTENTLHTVFICYYRLVTEYQSVRDLPSHNLGVLISEIKVFPGCFLLRPLSLLIGNSLLNLFAHGLPFCMYLCPNLLLLKGHLSYWMMAYPNDFLLT